MNDLKGARVMITGATGFLGQHVSILLAAAGAELIPVSRRFGFDLTDEARALSAILVARPDIVIHLAAPREDAPPATAVRDALLMGLNVLDACSMARAKLVMVSRHGPSRSPHYAVQQALFAAARAHMRQHGLSFVQLVPCDVYGPLDHFDSKRPFRLIPSIISRLLDAKTKDTKTLVLDGDGKKPFPLLYVEDAAQAVVMACTLSGCSESLGICGPESLKLERISAAAARCVEYKGDIEWDQEAYLWQPATQNGAIARKILGWEPVTKVEQGLKATYEWLSKKTAVVT